MKRIKRHLALLSGTLCLTLGAVAPQAQAGPVFSFTNITHNNPVSNGQGEAQLFVEVNEVGELVSFLFTNTGPDPMFIANVFFDDGSLLAIATIIEGPGVAFTEGGSPGDLPGGEGLVPAFDATSEFLADADPPVGTNGVDPGEWLDVRFTLQEGREYAHVLAELASTTLRIGLKVQGFDTGDANDSESFVNNPEFIPLPPAGILASAGLLGLLLLGVTRRSLLLS